MKNNLKKKINHERAKETEMNPEDMPIIDEHLFIDCKEEAKLDEDSPVEAFKEMNLRDEKEYDDLPDLVPAFDGDEEEEAFVIDQTMNEILRNRFYETDTTNFFKARLTSGSCSTLSWFEDVEEGCGGRFIAGTSDPFTEADPNVLRRFILVDVPKEDAWPMRLLPEEYQSSPELDAFIAEHK